MTAERVGTAASGEDRALRLAGLVLAEVVDGVPYSSTSQFHEYFGDSPVSAAYGLSCAFQSFEVGRLLAGLGGPPVSYLVDGRHVPAVIRRPDGLVVLDPYLMHREPLVLRAAEARPGGAVVATVPALPVRTAADGTARPSRVRAVWRPERGRMRLEYVRFRPSLDGYAVSRVFTLDTARELRAVPPPADVVRPMLLHPEQNNLSIRAVEPDSLLVREVVYPLTGPARHRSPSPDGLLVRDNQGRVHGFGEPGFAPLLGELATTLGVAAIDVVEFVLSGARIHRRVAPPDLHLPDYQAVDE